ncbi:MAG: trypsin-like peptidase domain-containing protein [Clostridia bacterium]|nr:trypsin-like peptidase domain-containing protein [Clostridia bacterium]
MQNNVSCKYNSKKEDENMMKRLKVLIVLCIVAVFAFGISASAAYLGDVDGNGKITASDARSILRVAANIASFDADKKAMADINSDNKITASDARKVLRMAANLENKIEIPDGGTVTPPADDKPLTAVEVHNIASKYTVEVNAENNQYVSTGSGFFISDDGQVVTNYHVIDGMYTITVTDYNNNTYKVDEVLAFDADMDIAVLKVDAVSTPAVLNTDVPETGSDAYTLGSSKGFTDTFSNGIISNGSRVVEEYNPNMTYIQTSAPISNGNSGGPLINNKAEVIGINTWGRTDGQNLNFAIPVKYLDALDYSNPMTMSEFASLFKPSEPEHNTLALDIMTHLRYIDMGGTAIIEVEVIGDIGDRQLYVDYDSNTLYCEWAEDWYISNVTGNDVAYLFVSGLQYSAQQYIRIYVEGMRDTVFVNIPVEVASDGWYDYGGYVGAVDYGAYLRIAPYVYHINDTATGIGFYYSLADMFDAGYSAEDVMTDFFDYLAYYGYEYIGYENNGYTFYCAEYDIYYSYSLVYDNYGDVTDIMIIFIV